MKKTFLFLLLAVSFNAFSQWINFAPSSAGTTGHLYVVSKNTYYYRAWNNNKAAFMLYYTNNGGISWEERPHANKPVFINDSTGFQNSYKIIGKYKLLVSISRTTDFAQTWPDTFPMIPDSAGWAETFAMGNDFIYSLNPTSDIFDMTYLVTDGGNKVDLVCNKNLYFIHFINDSVGFGLDKKSFSIYKTTNAGMSWNLFGSNISDYLITALQFTSEDTAYCLSGPIMKSINGGLSWDTIRVSKYLYDLYFISNEVGFVLAWENTDRYYRLYYTKDAGDTWKQLGDVITDKNINKMDVITDQDSIYFFFSCPGEGVTNLYKGTFALADILAGEKEANEITNSNYQLYPNPASNTISLRCEGYIPCTGTMQIINLQGQVMLQKEIRANETETDISALPKGFYLVKVIDEKGVWVSKIMKD